jgi:hypothetical protein
LLLELLLLKRKPLLRELPLLKLKPLLHELPLLKPTPMLRELLLQKTDIRWNCSLHHSPVLAFNTTWPQPPADSRANYLDRAPFDVLLLRTALLPCRVEQPRRTAINGTVQNNAGGNRVDGRGVLSLHGKQFMRARTDAIGRSEGFWQASLPDGCNRGYSSDVGPRHRKRAARN